MANSFRVLNVLPTPADGAGTDSAAMLRPLADATDAPSMSLSGDMQDWPVLWDERRLFEAGFDGHRSDASLAANAAAAQDPPPICAPAVPGIVAIFWEYAHALAGSADDLALFNARHPDWVPPPAAVDTKAFPGNPQPHEELPLPRSPDVAVLEEWLAAKASGSPDALALFNERHPEWTGSVDTTPVFPILPDPVKSFTPPSSPADWLI
jgi:hypothetical protein